MFDMSTTISRSRVAGDSAGRVGKRRCSTGTDHLSEALKSFLGSHGESVIGARCVVNPLLELWEIAHEESPLTARPVERMLTTLRNRQYTSREELAKMAAEMQDAATTRMTGPLASSGPCLMVNLLFGEDRHLLTDPGAVRTLFDPACGTGAMLSVAGDQLRVLNPSARLEVFGQELNDETYANCRSDMMLKGTDDASHVVCGNSLSEDGHLGRTFDYLIANPPFGVEWKDVEDAVRAEHETQSFSGRFGAGLPCINDGSFLFLQHMISKMKLPEQGGSRLAIVFNGSPLFAGGAGSGESEIRRWIIEKDWLEAVVALPDQLFDNIGISTYLLVITNRKHPQRRGKVQLVDARDFLVQMRESGDEMSTELSAEQIDEITRLYAEFTEGDRVKVFSNEEFGYQHITVERPLRLRWEVTDDTVSCLSEAKAWGRLSEAEQNDLRVRLMLLEGTSATEKVVLAKKLGAVPKILQGALWNALADADPEAPAVTNRRGEPKPNVGLRDTEDVPLPAVVASWEADTTERLASVEYRTVVDDYMTAEVLPYADDAWVDYAKTTIGYEIPLAGHFYTYLPARPSVEIDDETEPLQVK